MAEEHRLWVFSLSVSLQEIHTTYGKKLALFLLANPLFLQFNKIPKRVIEDQTRMSNVKFKQINYIHMYDIFKIDRLQNPIILQKVKSKASNFTLGYQSLF